MEMLNDFALAYGVPFTGEEQQLMRLLCGQECVDQANGVLEMHILVDHSVHNQQTAFSKMI